MPDLEELGAHYRACTAATLTARKAWCDAELAWNECAQPRKVYETQGREGHLWPDCACGRCAAAVTKAYADVEFCRACEVAAGEDYKGETFEAVQARHNRGRRPEVPV